MLSTLATVREELLIVGEEAYLTRLLNEATALIESYCWRQFHFVANTTETHIGWKTIVLRRPPVVRVVTVTVDGVLVTDWTLSGRLVTRRGDWPTRAEIRVVYDSGWVTPEQVRLTPTLTRTLPFDVERACIDLVVHLFRTRGEDKAITGESVGKATVAYDRSGLPVSIAESLKRYQLWT